MKRILIVEDEFQICNAMKSLLESDGYRVSCAFNGREALEQLERELPNLIILDYIMPIMTGREFLDHLGRRYEKAPVILMSEVETTPSSSSKPWQAFLKKPFTAEGLHDVVNSLI